MIAARRAEVTMLEALPPHAASFPMPRTQAGEPFEGTVSQASGPGSEEAAQEGAQTSRTLPGQKAIGPDGRNKDSVELSREAEEIRKLQVRDREVRAHEAAHAAAGGAYAGSPTYNFERGPDGRTYAVGGEVSIDVAPVSGDPEATLLKAQQVRAAALAPAQPSGQDLKVAQRAAALAARAQAELSQSPGGELPAGGAAVAGVSAEKTSAQVQDPGGSDPTPQRRFGSWMGGTSETISRLDTHA